MCSITVAAERAHVTVRNDSTGRGFRASWSVVLEFGRQLSYRARPGYVSEPDLVGPLWIRRDGDEIVLTEPAGGVFAVIPCHAAIEVGGAIIGKAHEAEEYATAEAVIFEQGLLARSGIVLGLGYSRAVREAGAREAAWNTQLRRYLPSSSKLVQGVAFRPEVRKWKPNQ